MGLQRYREGNQCPERSGHLSRVTQPDPGTEVGFRLRPVCHNAMFNPLENFLHLEGGSRVRSDVGVWRLISGYERWRCARHHGGVGLEGPLPGMAKARRDSHESQPRKSEEGDTEELYWGSSRGGAGNAQDSRACLVGRNPGQIAHCFVTLGKSTNPQDSLMRQWYSLLGGVVQGTEREECSAQNPGRWWGEWVRQARGAPFSQCPLFLPRSS